MKFSTSTLLCAVAAAAAFLDGSDSHGVGNGVHAFTHNVHGPRRSTVSTQDQHQLPKNRPTFLTTTTTTNSPSSTPSSLLTFQLFSSVVDPVQKTTKENKRAVASKTGKKISSRSDGTSSLATESEIRSLFGLWNDALLTLDSRIVASRYAPSATLLPTVSDVLRDDYESIKDYFDAFLLKKPSGTIIESHVTIGPDGTWAQDNGIYEFIMRADGSKVKARYTFTYVKKDPSDPNSQWLIQHHHSSAMPEGLDHAQPIDPQGVRNLFQLWNSALATLDPTAVTNRYSSKTVSLLPTVSDVPRTDHESINDYFVNFLKNKPQGTILQSFVKIGTNWCSDSGIYEFTMGASGNVVKARYTFVYTYEDGQWKISHHHSSQMPEEIEPKKHREILTEQETRNLFDRWNKALATGDPKKVAALYSKESILLPTVSDKPRTDKDSITDYFVNFLKNKPQGVIKSGMVKTGENWAKDAGVYEFTFGDGSKVMARYTFVYTYEDGDWKIAHHHSSVMPEYYLNQAKTKTQEGTVTPSDNEVRDLFQVWNNALATGDADKVAACYSKDACLLPTVSDTPRRTKEAITDYFVSFLKNEPQGVIKDGVIISGEGWAKDSGVYEFTMGKTNDKVVARYTFVYVQEDGKWKIAHHHSSAMPEPLMASAAKVKMLETILSE